MAAVYGQTGGDIKSVLRPLLLSPELLQSPPILKRPFDYAVSALRAFNVDTDGGIGVQNHLEAMGEPLFAWPMPDGFPEGTRAWTGALIPALELRAGPGRAEGREHDPGYGGADHRRPKIKPQCPRHAAGTGLRRPRLRPSPG